MSRVRGKMTALVINDIDAGVGHFKQTQTTVNNQVRPFVPQRPCPFQASGICMNVCTSAGMCAAACMHRWGCAHGMHASFGNHVALPDSGRVMS